MRLNAYLARAGVASRRGADKLISAGRVKVNGRTGQLNDDVSEKDKVELDDQPIAAQKLSYILYFKPERTVTTLSDPEGRPTILDDVKVPERVVPVGRLDFDTTGALILTNDGPLAQRLMHPSFELEKVYEATIKGKLSDQILNKLSIGVELDGRKTAPAKVRGLADNKIELTIHEGRYHQVKRMLETVGLETLKLHRSMYGPIGLGELKPGQWRELSPQEIQKLKAS